MRTMLLGLMAMGLMLTACQGPQNYGEPKSYRTESRLPDEGPVPGSADLLVATERAVEGIAAVQEIRSATGPTIIVLDRIENRTSDPSADFQIYLARIRALLNQSGARENLTFVATRRRAEEIRQREGMASGAARTRPHYALTGAFYDMPRGRTNFHLLTFQLVDLTNDIIAWEGSYEVKL